jgi:hypothetical protein
MQAKNHPLTIYFNVLTYYREEKHYETEPNPEFRQVCCLYGPGNWTQRQCVSVVRGLPVSDGSGEPPLQIAGY